MLVTDIPRDKARQEDRVVESLLGRLACSGEIAQLVERPDRLLAHQRTYAAVTSDALIRVTTSGIPVDWAVDVTSLAAPSRGYIVPSGLLERLDPLAAKHGVVIEVVGGIAPEPRQLREVQSAMESALRSGSRHGALTAEGLGLAWRPPGPGESAEFCIRSMLLPARSSLLSDQVEDTLRNPLQSKATKQAARAREAGCHTAVAIDRLGHRGIAQGSHWLPRRPETIREAVSVVLAEADHTLDACLLLDLGGDWRVLFGEFPGVN